MSDRNGHFVRNDPCWFSVIFSVFLSFLILILTKERFHAILCLRNLPCLNSYRENVAEGSLRSLLDVTSRHRRWTSDMAIFLSEKEHPPLSGTKGGIGPKRTDTLRITINRPNLTVVHLDAGKELYGKVKEKVLSCVEKVCPNFGLCSESSSSVPAEACWMPELSDPQTMDTGSPLNCPVLSPRPKPGSPPVFDPKCSHGVDFIRHEKITARVVILRNVYINSHGHLFTEKYHYNRGGCASDSNYTFSNGTRVQVFKEMVNLAHWNAYAFFHGMVELLPAFLLLADVLQRREGIPVAHRAGQHKFLESVGLPLLGIRADQLNIHEIKDDSLFFVEKVFQPWYAPCARPSRAQWQLLRQRHLLPPQGLPMFHPNWTLRTPPQGSSAGTGGQDWVVVLARRPGERALRQRAQVEAQVRSLFGPHRLRLFDGTLPIFQTKELFNRARLFVAGHGAAMANMFFMPEGGHVLELRPRDYPNSCFHFLAEVSRLHYYLLLGGGTSTRRSTWTWRGSGGCWRASQRSSRKELSRAKLGLIKCTRFFLQGLFSSLLRYIFR